MRGIGTRCMRRSRSEHVEYVGRNPSVGIAMWLEVHGAEASTGQLSSYVPPELDLLGKARKHESQNSQMRTVQLA
jgi:hypothetical protein